MKGTQVMNPCELAQLTHSRTRLLFVLGAPLTTAARDPAPEAESQVVKWGCGCQAMGPFRSTVWKSCELHAYYK